MDFRSQLSAFQSGGGSGGAGGSDRSPQRPPNNNRGYSTANSNNYNTGRGSSGGGAGGGGDRRRPRDRSPHDYPQGRGAGGPPPHSRRRFQSPDRDGLGDLRQHGYKIPRGLPPAPTAEDMKKPKHLALLMICIEDLPYEHIWKEFCATLQVPEGTNDEYHISLLCHARYPKQVKSEWLKQRLLVYPPKSGRGNSYLDPDYMTRTPNWGSVEITRAMLDLLHTGLKIGHDSEKDMRFSTDRFLVRRPAAAAAGTTAGDDSEEEKLAPIPEVDQFLYVSETCLPVATAQEFFDAMNNAVSWVNARHRKDPGTPKNAYENDQFGMINRRIPGQYRWKADQWTLLCRKHASQIIGIDRPHIPHKYHLWNSYREINASDEMYIPTSLALLGYLRFTAEGEDTQRLRAIVPTDESSSKPGSAPTPSTTPAAPSNTFEFVKKRPVTYTDWTEGARNPATFAKGIADFQKVSRLARDKGCLVARKFAPYVALPGVSKKVHTVTGQISAEEWKREIELLAAEQKTKAASTAPPQETSAKGAAPKVETKPAETKQATEDDEPEEESFLGTRGKSGASNAKEGENEDEEESDDGEEEEDDGENQLE